MGSQIDKKRRLKRVEILNGAAEVFREKGFRTTTMDDIANQLMLTKGSLYYYFNSKDEIIYNAHDHSLDMVNRIIERIEPSDSAEARLRQLLTDYMQVIMTEPTALLAATQFEPLRGEYCRRIFDKRRIFEVALRRILTDGVTSGVFEPYSPKILGFVILGALNWIARWYSPKGEMNPEQVIDIISDVLIRAVLKRQPDVNALRQNLTEIGSMLEECGSILDGLKSLAREQDLNRARRRNGKNRGIEENRS